MAINRVTLEIDDTPESSPNTGATLDSTSGVKAIGNNETAALGQYDDAEATKIDMLKLQKPTIGRTFGDILVEFRDDPRVMTVFLVILSFVIFISKLDSVSNFDRPLALGLVLNLIWHLIPFVMKKRATK